VFSLVVSVKRRKSTIGPQEVYPHLVGFRRIKRFSSDWPF